MGIRYLKCKYLEKHHTIISVYYKCKHPMRRYINPNPDCVQNDDCPYLEEG